MKKYSLQETKKEYNGKVQVKAYSEYAKYGLWVSEKLVFEKYIAKGDMILDVGCGAGRTTLGLYKLGYKNIAGLDLSDKLIKQAQKLAKENKADIQFTTGNALELKYRASSFNKVIFSYNGLMCIPGRENRYKAVQEIFRVLKPGGLFIFTTHDRNEGRHFFNFWKEEKIRWEKGEQDSTLSDFGDLYITDEKEGDGFVHIATTKEVFEMLDAVGFRLFYTEMRDNICQPPQYEQDNFSNCRFYVAKKNEKE